MKKSFLPLLFAALTLVYSSCTRTIDVPPPNPIDPIETVENPNEWDNNPYKLNMVYFVPNDLDTLANFKERLSIIMYDIQEFYAANMDREGYGRRSFGFYRTNGKINFIVVRGKSPKAYYSANGGHSITNEIDEYFVAHPTERKGIHSMVFVPQFGGGLSQPFHPVGRDCVVQDYAALGSTLLRGGGEAHELGHAFSVPHNAATKSTQATLGTALMGTGVFTYKDKPTFLTATDCAILSRIQAFATTTRADWYTTQSLQFTNVYANTSNNTFTISGKFDATMPVAAMAAYHDTRPFGVNSDYDALSFKGKIIGADSFHVVCPLGDFFNTTDTAQLRLKFVFDNGYTVDKNITYRFQSNVPVVTNLFPAPIVSGSNYALFTMLNNTSVLDVSGEYTADGSRVVLWAAKTPPSNNQVWKVSAAANGYYKLEPLHAPGKVLEVAGGVSSNFAQIQISTFNNTNGQLWKLYPQLGGGYELAPASAPNSRVDVADTRTNNGARIQLYQSNSNNAQKWRFAKQ